MAKNRLATPWTILADLKATLRYRDESAPIATGGICPRCGFYNTPESNVRDVDDGRIFCNHCGDMFEVR